MRDYAERSQEVKAAMSPLVDLGWVVSLVETEDKAGEPFRVILYIEYDPPDQRSVM